MERTGAQILMETLIEQGVDTVFGYPGGAVLPIYDALYQCGGRLRHVLSCHEQGATHAADGYARATGKTGVVFATSGPGATNLVTGLATAYLDSTPLVAVTGNVPLELLGRDSFQEVDILGITMPITKHNYMVKDVRNLAGIIREAFHIANSGRPGPVLIDIPKNVQADSCEWQPGLPLPRQTACVPCESELQRAAALLDSCQRPFIYAGGGIISSGASAQLLSFAELLDAPVGASIMGLAGFPQENPRFVGMTGMHGTEAANRLLCEADLILVLGSRFSDRATGDKARFANGARILHIDIDPAEIDKNIPCYNSLVGDVGGVLELLFERLSPRKNAAWWERIAQIRAESLLPRRSGLTPQLVIETVRRHAREDTVVATDVGQHQMWVAQTYRFSRPRTFLTSGGLGTMGFGLGAAIGACIGSGGRETVLFTGDGSFHMNLNELATAVSYRLPLRIFLINNGVLGMVYQWQHLFYENRFSCTQPERKTDFKALAEAFGAQGFVLSDAEDAEAIVSRAFACEGVALVDCRIAKNELVLPMIPPGGSMYDLILSSERGVSHE